MTKLVDPIALLMEKASAESAAAAVAATGIDPNGKTSVPYELPLVPPAGARLMHVTCGSTYGKPIPALFDPATRTTYPLAAN